jgi:hypothetical protein
MTRDAAEQEFRSRALNWSPEDRYLVLGYLFSSLIRHAGAENSVAVINDIEQALAATPPTQRKGVLRA